MIETLVENDSIEEEIRKHNTDPAAVPWVLDFLRGLLTPATDLRLKTVLVSIGCNTFNTTFPEDYDYSKDDLRPQKLFFSYPTCFNR